MQPNDAFKKQIELYSSMDDENSVETEFILSFDINGSRFGLSFFRVHEVVDFFSPTPYPFPVEGHVGVINLRGNVVPVIDPYHHKLKDCDHSMLKYVIIKTSMDCLVGLIVNNVKKIEVELDKIDGIETEAMLNFDSAPLRFISVDYLLREYEDITDESA